MIDPRATHRDLSPCPRCGTPNVSEVVMYAGDLQPYIALHHHRCMWLAPLDPPILPFWQVSAKVAS